ncbi:uncharacterized protein LOC114934119 [Nylanderia fulva]|uniref:uncharacterized protein LOC114934119 n=1 Tax=Nylanderia fulva TaxID=613905 RepID=UPI0010FB630F|nr:uncharacterized protein LOC114934119 [Nylanderia fulva]
MSDINEAKLLIEELTQLLRAGGFELHKWRSNRMEVLTGGNELSNLTDVQAITDERDTVKTLDLLWQPSSDDLQCPQTLLASIWERFWPLNGRNLARKIVRECTVCFKVNLKVSNQIMGSLPPERITCQRTFSVVGVDYAGPINTLATTSELTTDAFLATLRRFVSRRGYPQKIYSDNATNFVGAKRELEELYTAIKTTFSNAIDDYCTDRHIQWSFIPPHAPYMGEIWEAGIKSCKYHLKRVMGEARLTFEKFSTVLEQIEACLNSRSLCSLSSDPSDLQALTPAHFLIGEPLTSLPDIDVTGTSINRLDR